MKKFYLIICCDDEDAFIHTDGPSIVVYETEEAAIAAAKEYSGTSAVVSTCARITENTTYKVEKIK